MPDTSRNLQSIDNVYWLRQSFQNGIPADCVFAYRKLLNQIIGHNKTLIDSIIQEAGGKIFFPMDTSFLEGYFDGFTFEYRPFTVGLLTDQGQEGHWEYSPHDRSHIIIFYNSSSPEHRQRFTKIHELFHFIQTLDRQFLKFLDELIVNTTLPACVVNKLLERGTDKAAAMYLMPNRYFQEKYLEIQQESAAVPKATIVEHLAQYFGVSRDSADFRLNECGIYVPI